MLKCLYNRVLEMFYPGRCALCDTALVPGRGGLCNRCAACVEYVREPRCLRCGKPVEKEEEYCQDCQGRESSFQRGYALFVYDSSLQESIARFKYQGRKEYAFFYATAMKNIYGDWIKSLSPQALIPVPIHPRRLQKRGYNQATLIATRLGEMMDIPVLDSILYRQKDTLPQKELSDRERKENLRGAFAVNQREFRLNLLQECVIIIDDIYTTGTTMEECSRVLRQVGIHRIYFLCVCIGKGF